ncbi:hypothetical protein CFE70_000383 [Pyrenophora teres f. teres 0-1]|uniref:Uncharacterized protein n=2 Tax=Pyrenophora teres f. teres TaxID=97479 RepID=E3S7D5_PYRTT|nr:hypothetical protein PTT_18728 [Pyrenophora teres f. teres 0-1]KAE8836355.1 hypothetical protein HRS9139_04453 [Pyrenophora teres f. teres]CAA9956793.1 hypothetical protein PTMSG1_00401 [Pyrenophora teres f. maculata]KAE8837674.1 hypothetical protein PTNB85_05009 [Pyrenophora teres f. teres]KAE8839907.1 hypothetical protein HRS9122_06512 [Pyrenophora teres f. teres]
MEEEDENADIAAAMGFASFGGTKKRKFDHTNSPKAKADASGANSTKLGVRMKKAAGADEEDSEKSAHQPTLAQSNAHVGSQKTQAAGSGLASFLARGQSLPDKPHGTATPPAPSEHSTADMVSFGGPAISRAELNALRNGVQAENGDTAYFLPSFVEDPWARLKKGVS